MAAMSFDDLEQFLIEEMRDLHEKNHLQETAPKALREKSIYLKGNGQALKAVIYSRYKIDFSQENGIAPLLSFNLVKLAAFKNTNLRIYFQLCPSSLLDWNVM